MKQLVAGAAVFCAVLLHSTAAHAINCVAYVKSVTNFSLMGDAWQWWDAADHLYHRGYKPAPGAIMVFSRTARMHVGHVAVVREVRGPREIIIDQANWHHGRIDRGVSVIDTSESNDWSRVKVQWNSHYYGGPFPITGFIYPHHAPGAEFAPETERSWIAHSRLVEAREPVRHGRAHGHVVLAGIPHAPKRAHHAAPVHHVVVHRGTVRRAAAHHAAPKHAARVIHVAQKAKPAAHVTKTAAKETKQQLAAR